MLEIPGGHIIEDKDLVSDTFIHSIDSTTLF